ncbi:MAG: response regulator transcription factor [Acidobacteria bacterium]|nr:response regulator transcription factor [Acidobacteriota bacterium]
MPLRALIVDDEPIARQVLREQMEDLPQVRVVGEAEHGIRALEQISRLKPDLIFLDLQMPGMDGFDVIRHLDGPAMPAIVIVTAFDEHAIHAFEAGAVDYLLKPVSALRLRRCIARIEPQRASSAGTSNQVAALREIANRAFPERLRKVVGKLGEEFHLLDCNQVLAFQAERELVWIVTRNQRYLATQPLRAIQQRLEGLHFTRIHRNALVNMNHVVKMAPLTSQRWLLTLANNQEFIVSKRQARTVQELLHW